MNSDLEFSSFGPYFRTWAAFSADGRHRLLLGRQWDPLLPDKRVLFCMLNPSDADEGRDDPTIRRCYGFAKAADFTSFEVVNLFTLIDANPSVLSRAAEPLWPSMADADARIIEAASARATQMVIAAWGAKPYANGKLRTRAAHVRRLLGGIGPVHCLRPTKNGAPEHPLYLPSDRRPVIWFEGGPRA